MCENTRTGDKVIIKRKTDLTNSVDETQNKTKEKNVNLANLTILILFTVESVKKDWRADRKKVFTKNNKLTDWSWLDVH